MNRYQLLELLIIQTNRADELQAQLDAVRRELEDRRIEMEQIGSIAEASVQVGGLLEAAQNTADLFLEATKKRIEEIEQEKIREAQQIVEEAREKASWILEYARKRAEEITTEEA